MMQSWIGFNIWLVHTMPMWIAPLVAMSCMGLLILLLMLEFTK